MKKISIIAAIQKKDRGIGFNNKLLFKIRDDLQRFKGTTLGNPIIMGRKTFESIGSNALPKRTNIVVSKSLPVIPEGIILSRKIEEALLVAQDSPGNEIFIIGGGNIYEQTLSKADRLYLTIVDGEEPADVFFPEYESEFRREVSRSDHHDMETGFDYSFITLER